MLITKNVLHKWYSSMKNFFWKIPFWHRKLNFKVRILHIFTTFTQVTWRFKSFLMGWLFVLGLKEGLVECVTVCVKSWIILLHMLLRGLIFIAKIIHYNFLSLVSSSISNIWLQIFIEWSYLIQISLDFDWHTNYLH